MHLSWWTTLKCVISTYAPFLGIRVCVLSITRISLSVLPSIHQPVLRFGMGCFLLQVDGLLSRDAARECGLRGDRANLTPAAFCPPRSDKVSVGINRPAFTACKYMEFYLYQYICCDRAMLFWFKTAYCFRLHVYQSYMFDSQMDYVSEKFILLTW